MELIIDIQGFQAANYVMVPKEIAVLTRDGSKLQHFIMKPPFTWENLSPKDRKTAIWLEKKIMVCDGAMDTYLVKTYIIF